MIVREGGGYFFFSALVFGADVGQSAASDLRSRDVANSVKRRSLRGRIACPRCTGIGSGS